MKLTPIDATYYINIIVLTGAGISVASGLRPYRGPGGLWDEVNIMEYATAEAMKSDPLKIWNFFLPLRAQLKEVEPNDAHYALAKFEAGLKSYQSFTLVTQNIDGLHKRAGSKNVVEMHGNATRTRCSNDDCELKPYVDPISHFDKLPRCQLCGSPLRMDVVLFGEGVATYDIKIALQSCDLFIAIGTSGEVYPASGFAQIAKSYGARTLLVNLEPIRTGDSNFHEMILGQAELILPQLLKVG